MTVLNIIIFILLGIVGLIKVVTEQIIMSTKKLWLAVIDHGKEIPADILMFIHELVVSTTNALTALLMKSLEGLNAKKGAQNEEKAE